MEENLSGKIEDLKNNLLAVQDKLTNLTMLVNNLKSNDTKLNEIMNLVHSINFERSNQNKTIFETICPDLIRRITEIERFLRELKEKPKKRTTSGK